MSAALPEVLKQAVLGHVPDPAAVLTAWEAAIGQDASRTATLVAGPGLARGLRKAGHLEHAIELCRAAELATPGPEIRATLVQVRLQTQLALTGTVTPHEIQAAARGLMDASDARLAKGQHAEATRLLHYALELLLDRALHTETTTSPLQTGAAAWMSTVNTARITAWLAAAAPRRVPARRLRRVRRVLVVTRDGSNFLEQVRDQATRAGIELREIVLSSLSGERWQLPSGPQLPNVRVEARLGRRPAVPAALKDGYAWADQVLVDWCDEAAVVVSATVPDDVELVVRLHSVEALSVPAHLVSWERVDRLVLVSTHIGTLLDEMVAGLFDVPRVVIPPAASTGTTWTDVPGPQVSHVLALVGWAQPVKDPIWALEVLAELRAADPAWRLLLVGRDQFAEPSHRVGVAQYAKAFATRREQPDVAGAVDHLPWLDDVTELCRHASAVLSSSIRESFAIGLHEAVDGGLLPVVRRWPLVAPYGAPGETCDPAWVVDTPAEAARRVLQHWSDEQARRSAWDWLTTELSPRVLSCRYRTQLRWPLPRVR